MCSKQGQYWPGHQAHHQWEKFIGIGITATTTYANELFPLAGGPDAQAG